MKKLKVINAYDVAGYSPPGDEDRYVSRLLVDAESVGSRNLVVNHFTLFPGQSTYLGSHPTPFEEVYYVLSGHGLLTLGGDNREQYEMHQHSIAYISDGVDHQLANTGGEPLEMLTIMPFHPTPGVNSLYDSRKREWGGSFRRAHAEKAEERTA